MTSQDRKGQVGGFPENPVVKNPPFNAGDAGMIPDLGTNISQALRHRPKKKKGERESICSGKCLPGTHTRAGDMVWILC